MKPLSSHWADLAAANIVRQRGEKNPFVLASGITPSGHIHVGNFREVVTVEFVAKALQALGKPVRFIYSWDNFDTFRKVPKNIPQKDSFAQHLRKAIARIPDPYSQADSYAEGRIKAFEAELEQLGIHPEYLYQEQKYSQNEYAQGIQRALQQAPQIREILNQHRTSKLAEDWLPTAIYCSQCGRDETADHSYREPWDYFYRCLGCGHNETVDIRQTKNLKLSWRVDWPMRWAYEGVDFEPGGKDHSSRGGSYDTGKEIVKLIWGKEAPNYLQYDFVMIKGGAGKMSSSSGELFTLSDVLSVYDPQIIRYLFASHRPNHDFAIAFDEDVIKMHDEFDRVERAAFEDRAKELSGKALLNQRVYQLSLVDSAEWEQAVEAPRRPKFRELANRLQIMDGDISRTLTRFYPEICSAGDRSRFMVRARNAWHWVSHYAPDEFRYTLNQEAPRLELASDEKRALEVVVQLLRENNLDELESKVLNDLIWAKLREVDCDPPKAFRVFYQKLIGRDRGPRLGGFLKEIGADRACRLLGT